MCRTILLPIFQKYCYIHSTGIAISAFVSFISPPLSLYPNGAQKSTIARERTGIYGTALTPTIGITVIRMITISI